jgi:hypothetical protein
MSTLDDKLEEIEARIKAFKHWYAVRPDIQPCLYEETHGPDMEALIAMLRKCREQRDTLAAELHAEYERRLGRKFPVDASRADAELLKLAEGEQWESKPNS